MKASFEKFFEEKLRELAKEPRVVDIGGGQPFQKDMAKYRGFFDNVRYETVDASAQYHPTYIADAHRLPFKDDEIPAIICKSVLEHLEDPKKAAEEMYRVLKPGGALLLYTHFIYPYHARHGVYKDCFRFTEDGLRYLFRNFSKLEIKKQGGYFFALMFFLPGQRYLKFALGPVALLLDKIFSTEKRTTTAGYWLFAPK